MWPEKIIFSISGARGLVSGDFSDHFVYSLVKSFCITKTPKKIIIGRDSRKSYKDLYPAIIKAISENQIEIVDLGLLPLPTISMAVKYFKADGAIMLTASHNTADYNGLKFLDSEGEFITEKDVVVIKTNFEYYNLIKKDILKIENKDFYNQAKDYHLQKVLKITPILKNKLKVAIDAVNGAGSLIVPELIQKIGCEPILIACNPEKDFPRNPEPNVQNLSWTKNELSKIKDFDLCVVVDPDADRLTLIDEKNNILSEELTLPLIAKYLINSGTKGSFVINLSTSALIEEVTSDSGISVDRSSVGEANVVAKMKQTKAVFGGEGNGGVIDPKIHYGRDSLVGIVYILALISQTGKSLGQLVSELPEYTIVKEKYYASSSELPQIAEKIKELFKEKDFLFNDSDGFWFSVPRDNFWIHLRASNTEPIIRLIYEYKKEKGLSSLLQKVLDLCSSLLAE